MPGGGELGSAMVAHPDVKAVSFTGSTQAGRSVGELAARHFTRAHLELGGNNAMIVLPDADLDKGINALAYGSFFNQGQGCMIIGRHLVHESIYDDYVRRLVAKAETLTVGNPNTGDVSLGPVIDAKQRDRIHGLVTDSVAAGAKLLTGGTYEGLFYRPTVLADAGPGVPAYDKEVFGPVACITHFSTLDEAVSWPRTPNTVWRLASSPPMSLPGWPWPSAFPPAPRTSTTRRCATTRTCRSAVFATRATHLASAPLLPTSRRTPTPDGSPCSRAPLPIPSDQRKSSMPDIKNDVLTKLAAEAG